jgi:hypothetical protein
MVKERNISHKCFEAQLIENHIFYLHFLPNSHSTEVEYKLGVDAYNELRNNKKKYVIIELGRHASLDKSAREYLQNNKFEALASAIVLNSLPQRIIFDFYLKFRRQSFPTKTFNSIHESKKWFQSLELKNND